MARKPLLITNNIIYPVILAAASMLLFLMIGQGPDIWDHWKGASCCPECSCEMVRDSMIRTPLNTYSNLAYIITAAIIWIVMLRTGDPGKRVLLRKRGYAVLLISTLLFLGLGSAFFHASLTFAGQWFDVMGMYLLTGYILLYALVRWTGLRGETFTLLYILINTTLGIILFLNPETRRIIFAAELAIALLAESACLFFCRPLIKKYYLVSALAVFAFSDRLRSWDMASWACRPDSIIQLHPLYHLVSAFAIGLLCLYYISETTRHPDKLRS